MHKINGLIYQTNQIAIMSVTRRFFSYINKANEKGEDMSNGERETEKTLKVMNAKAAYISLNVFNC